MLLSLLLEVANVVVDPTTPPGGGGVDIPDAPPAAPGGLEDVASQWISWAKWATMFAGALGGFWCAIMMAIGRKNRSHLAGEGASGLLWVVGALSAAAVVIPTINAML